MRLSNLVLVLLITPITLLFFSCQKKIDSPTDPQGPTGPELKESLKKDLWAYYPFSNGSFADQSGNNHALTPSNNMKISYDMLGNPNEALEFNEADDYAIIDAGKDFPDGDFSISFTMMPTSLSGTLFQKADAASNKGYSFSVGLDNIANNNTLLFATNNTSDPCSNVFNTNTETTVSCSRTLFTNAWYYVCIIYSGGVEQVYINSEVEADLKTSAAVLQHCKSAPFYLGVPSTEGIPNFIGKIDNLRIYTRALTPQEVVYIMESN